MNTARTRKIAVVTPYGAQANYDNYAEFILAQTLIERGWGVHLYTYAVRGRPGFEQDAVYKEVPVFRCRQRLGLSPKLFFSLLAFRPEVIISFHPKSRLSFTAFLASKCMGVRYVADLVGLLHDPFIVNDTDNPEGNFKNPIHLVTDMRMLLADLVRGRVRGLWTNFICHVPTKHADAIVSMNAEEQKHTKAIYKRESTLIYWCTPRYRETAEVQPPVDIPERYYLFIGQIKGRKGWDTAIEAMAERKKQGDHTPLVFLSPSKDLSAPTELARSLDVLSDIIFLSALPTPEKNWLLTHATYVLIPSRFEGFGLVVFEAFLAGKPVCASDIPTFLEFLKDRTNAVLFPVGDGAGLAQAIETLDADPALREAMVKEGFATAERFNHNHMTDSYVTLFDSLQHIQKP